MATVRLPRQIIESVLEHEINEDDSVYISSIQVEEGIHLFIAPEFINPGILRHGPGRRAVRPAPGFGR